MYAEHIRELCQTHGIEHRHTSILERSCSWADQRAIETPHVDDELTYFVALHEIGHIMHAHEATTWRIDRRALQKEGQAWQWAFDNALHEPSEAVARTSLTYLLSYWSAAKRRGIKRSPSEYAYARNYLTNASRSRRAPKVEQLALAV